jgi:glycosyltransferase involved in cell wall biosynthesis
MSEAIVDHDPPLSGPPPGEDPELTILMPCLNEAETLPVCIGKAREFLDKSGISGEVLVADNGSTDGSQELARRCGARVVEEPRRGYGNALRAGFAAARGRYIVMGDADDSYDFASLSGFVDRLRDGHDLVMGNRFLGGIAPRAMPPLHRYLGNPLLSLLGRLFFGSRMGDFHCGLRGITRQAAHRMKLQSSGMEFASEMVVKATLLNMSVTEIPVSLTPDGRSRRPHLRPWRDGWRHLRFMLMYTPRWLFLYPGLTLILAGLVLVGMLMLRPVAIGGINLDIHTMLFAALMVISGMQAVLFAIVSHQYAINQGLALPDSLIRRLGSRLQMETGLVAGALLVAAGLVAAGLSIYRWWLAGWGDLDPRQTMRTVILSCLFLSAGIQICFASFFLGMLSIRRHDDSS